MICEFGTLPQKLEFAIFLKTTVLSDSYKNWDLILARAHPTCQSWVGQQGVPYVEHLVHLADPPTNDITMRQQGNPYVEHTTIHPRRCAAQALQQAAAVET